MLHFQFGLFESINLPPVWAPIKKAALQSLHSAVASCRVSFLFTTGFVCLSPLSPILGTLWTETQHPPSPEQGLAHSPGIPGNFQGCLWTAAASIVVCHDVQTRAVPHQRSHPGKFKFPSQTGMQLLHQKGIYTSTLPIPAARRHQGARASFSALLCVQAVQLHRIKDSGAPLLNVPPPSHKSAPHP